MTVKQKLFWCCVVFPDFIKHFRKMNDEQIVRDIRQSMDDLEDLVSDTDTFGSQMVRWALERLEEPAAVARRENGKKGGRPRKNNVDAATREGSDESTTVSRNMPRVGQNGTHPRIQGGKRAAQGAMSPSPSGAAQDGKFRGSAKTKGESNTGSTVQAVCPESCNIYDQETSRTSTNEARESQRAGGNSVRRVAKVSTPPVRSAGPMPSEKEPVLDYAAERELDEADAYNCWYVTVKERGGCDADGNPVSDWKAFVKKWCATAEKNRKRNKGNQQ